jgi:hypothetical protein
MYVTDSGVYDDLWYIEGAKQAAACIAPEALIMEPRSSDPIAYFSTQEDAELAKEWLEFRKQLK